MDRRLVAPLVFLAVTAAACAPAAPTSAPVDLAADEQAVRAISMQWLEYQRAKNFAPIAALFADNGTMFREDEDPIVGHAAIEASLTEDQSENPNSTVSWTTDRVDVAASGDQAVEYGTWSDTGMGPTGTETDNGKYVTVYRKVDGTWKIVADMSMSTKPAAATTTSN